MCQVKMQAASDAELDRQIAAWEKFAEKTARGGWTWEQHQRKLAYLRAQRSLPRESREKFSNGTL